jgi:predicted metalloprotease
VWSTPLAGAAARRLLHSGEVMAGRWLAAAGIAAALVVAGCATDSGVATESAQRLDAPITPPTTEPPDTTAPPAPTTEPPTTIEPAPTTQPGSAAPPTTSPSPGTTGPVGDLGGQLDFGDAKSPRSYDDFLTKALTDIQHWWVGEFPKVYGKPFQPMRGKIYAGYPERTTEIPGCETQRPTTYDDIHQFSAFYCAQGDFMVYDDGPDGLLNKLADQFGPSILGVVFAHEFGHAVQNRAGILQNELPTITTEQQADCFAGAWVAHVASGGGEGITFSDADVRSGLVAMIQVRDPKGIDQFTEGGHGSAFDRVGAFQVGFTEGAARCAQLIDHPLPLVPNTFQAGESGDGDAPYGYGESEIVGRLVKDLNDYWSSDVNGVTVPPLTVVPVQAADDVDCPQPFGDLRMGAVYCPATARVFLDEPLAKDLYTRFGDFVVGYILGGAWSEAAQIALHSPLQGEQRLLVDDCMTGGWTKTILPDENGDTQRSGEKVAPGDLDEAIQAALVLGDESANDDQPGTGFEQIAQFRQGVLDGLDACTAQIGG